MTINTRSTWIRRVAAGAVLAAAPALIALGTAAASQAESSSSSFAPTPSQTTEYPNASLYQSFHQRHAAEVQSWYR
jgi:hypothetical protein